MSDERYRDKLRWRGIHYADEVCETCHGAGSYMYGNTATWRSGPGVVY